MLECTKNCWLFQQLEVEKQRKRSLQEEILLLQWRFIFQLVGELYRWVKKQECREYSVYFIFFDIFFLEYNFFIFDYWNSQQFFVYFGIEFQYYIYLKVKYKYMIYLLICGRQCGFYFNKYILKYLNVKNIVDMFKNKENVFQLLFENCFNEYIIMCLFFFVFFGSLRKLCVFFVIEIFWF